MTKQVPLSGLLYL